jgi:PAS domain S-box-containing protein
MNDRPPDDGSGHINLSEALTDPEALESLLAALVESSDDAIIAKDDQAIVHTWNKGAENLYGYTRDEAVGRHISFLIPDDRKGEEHRILDQILAGQKVDHYETARVKKNGDLVDISLTVSPIVGGGGRIIGASVIARDIGEKKRAEKVAREQDRHDFVARVAHELRTPLVTMTGLTEMIQARDSEMDIEKRSEIFDAVLRQGHRAHRLVDDLLELSRVGVPGFRVTLTPTDVRAVVHDTIRDFVPPEGVSVSEDCEVETPVLADAHRLEQILGNLLTNAYKYGGASIMIRCTSNGPRVEVAVEDNGTGVPSHVADTLFEPFVRGGGSEKGFGLGLSIARRLARALEGELTYENLEPHGSRFVVALRPAG